MIHGFLSDDDCWTGTGQETPLTFEAKRTTAANWWWCLLDGLHRFETAPPTHDNECFCAEIYVSVSRQMG